MSADPMIGGKSREQWAIEEARIKASIKPDHTSLKFCAGYSVLLLTAGIFGHELHEVVPMLALLWAVGIGYMIGRSK